MPVSSVQASSWNWASLAHFRVGGGCLGRPELRNLPVSRAEAHGGRQVGPGWSTDRVNVRTMGWVVAGCLAAMLGRQNPKGSWKNDN